MRDALGALTLRGRGFIAAGITAIGCAVVLGQTTLVRIGVLLLMLPLVAAYVVGRQRHRVQVSRVLNPRVVAAGQTARVELELADHGGSPLGALLVEDQVPYALGTRPRFVLRGLSRGWQRTVRYQVRSDVRGEFAIGPLTVRTGDPFGLLDLHREIPGVATLTVMPRVTPLPSNALAGAGTGSGDHRPKSFAAGSAEDVSVREYRRGDELRRVHWRSSARIGELMVRREEQPWEARATVLLDNRINAHRGRALGSSFETAVSAAASITQHLDHLGYAVRFVSTDGVRVESGSTAVLERLATIATGHHTVVDTHGLGESGHGGLMVAVLGSLDDDDLPLLRRLRHHAATALALCLDVPQWAGSPADPDRQVTGPALACGWRAVALAPRDRLEAAWTELGRAAAPTTTVSRVPVGGGR